MYELVKQICEPERTPAEWKKTIIVPIYKIGDLVWFGLFVHPFSHICYIGHVNYRLQFTTQLIICGHPNNKI
jgi:hypothetical protein